LKWNVCFIFVIHLFQNDSSLPAGTEDDFVLVRHAHHSRSSSRASIASSSFGRTPPATDYDSYLDAEPMDEPEDEPEDKPEGEPEDEFHDQHSGLTRTSPRDMQAQKESTVCARYISFIHFC